MTLWPRLASSTGSEPTTSPRPPVLDQGATSVETKTIFIGLAAFGVYPAAAALVCGRAGRMGRMGRIDGGERGAEGGVKKIIARLRYRFIEEEE